MSLEELVALSRRYGSDPDYVLAGGGNTSFKDESTLYIKASGFPLSTIGPDGFVKMDRAKLAQIRRAAYPEEPAGREARALQDLMNARRAGEENKRPSVETLLHEALEEAYVVHTHPTLVNGLTCSVGARARARELFGDRALWIPVVDPGYLLARTVRRLRSAYIATHGRTPEFILLQNHGIFVSADDPAEIERRYDEVFDVLDRACARRPDLSRNEGARNRARDSASGDSEAIARRIEAAIGEAVAVFHSVSREMLRFLADAESFAPVSSAFTPDHIVYSGHMPCYVGDDARTPGAVKRAIEENRRAAGRSPKIVAVKNLGAFGVGRSAKAAETAALLFEDAVRIAVYSECHRGPQPLPPSMIEFILDWEVEQYRSNISG